MNVIIVVLWLERYRDGAVGNTTKNSSIFFLIQMH